MRVFCRMAILITLTLAMAAGCGTATVATPGVGNSDGAGGDTSSGQDSGAQTDGAGSAKDAAAGSPDSVATTPDSGTVADTVGPVDAGGSKDGGGSADTGGAKDVATPADTNPPQDTNTGPVSCKGPAGCSAGQVCLKKTCDKDGTCVSGIACGYNPSEPQACGCDGKNYKNACEAEVAGVGVKKSGPCDLPPPTPCKTGADQCGKGTFCKANTCSSDMPGVCTPMPLGCTKEYKPVCGCDGKTYGNACMADSAGVNLHNNGACKDPAGSCGGKMGLTCGTKGQWCSLPGCGADLLGKCVPQPAKCPIDFVPNCGCDNKTYASNCDRIKAGVGPKSPNACKPDTGGCVVGNSGECGSGQYCAGPMGSCGQKGVCAKIPGGMCTMQYDPVCGCNKKTYSNGCVAANAGVVAASKGACK